MLSMVIPTYKEADNIGPLLSRLDAVLSKLDEESEVIIVDDSSPDNTADVAQGFRGRTNIRIIRRAKRGLPSAISHGLAQTRGDIMGVMDSDLSHPPELIPKMLSGTESSDMVIASRYVRGATNNNPAPRRVISYLSRIPIKPLTHIKDPLSGFFLLRRDILKQRPSGFKTCLGIISLCEPSRITEIPYTFTPRKRGRSKLGPSQGLLYLLQAATLYARRCLPRKQ